VRKRVISQFREGFPSACINSVNSVHLSIQCIYETIITSRFKLNLTLSAMICFISSDWAFSFGRVERLRIEFLSQSNFNSCYFKLYLQITLRTVTSKLSSDIK
jgi:hypothetical protein